ncbi:PLP-dependent aminotransferase family protein, partial [Leucobacter sp. M11]|nr:PLP-dependent aminotransferase family protein [Leucobacter sp. M11]
LDWAERSGAVLLEDDYDSEYRYSGALLPAIASLDEASRVLHIGSLNKTLSPSVRCGYLILRGRGELREAIWAIRGSLGPTVSAATQATLAEFLASGGYRRYVARTRREYRHRREAVLDTLGGLGAAARLTAVDGGLHAVLELGPGIDAAAAQHRLAGRGVRLETLADLSADPGRGGNALVIGYGAEPVTRLRRALGEIAALVREAGSQPPVARAEP